MSNEDIDNIDNAEVENIEPEVEINADPAALLEDARNKADEHWNELLRARADMENLRRRQARDLENAHKHALDRFVAELLPVYDSMELGFNKFGLEQVNPTDGDAFDPELHQAMAMQPVEGVEANKVITVAQKGFQFNGRLLRPAMVVVSQ